LIGTLFVLAGWASARAEDVRRFAGLPVHPAVARNSVDPWLRTDSLGHWCAHLTGRTSASIEEVAAWYRNNWPDTSETDIAHDVAYAGAYAALQGIKLSLGFDSVAIYRIAPQAPTMIDIYRCGFDG
jgi:hypothetical protein